MAIVLADFSLDFCVPVVWPVRHFEQPGRKQQQNNTRIKPGCLIARGFSWCLRPISNVQSMIRV